MEALAQSGKARRIGVSNVSVEQLRELYAKAETKPAFVQNRCYARTGWDRNVRAFCREHEIVYQGFSLLTANQHELASPLITRLARLHRCSPAEIVFRFALGVGMLPLTGTSNPGHMRRDLGCKKLDLTLEEITELERISG